MMRIRFLTALGAAAAVLLFASACSDTAVDDGAGAIRVTGSGEVRAAPTIATVRTGVEVRAASVTAARAAGDAVRFDGIVFAHDDPGALAQEARALALADARGKAEQLATLSGVTLGAVRSITETRGTAPFAETPAAFAMDMDMPADTATRPGTAAVTVTLQVVWAIAPEE